MAGPISQVEVENQILRLLEDQERAIDEFEDLSVSASEAEADYKREWTKDFISQKDKGTIKDREAWADYKNAGLFREWKVAEAMVKAKRERLSSIRTAVDALRTINANVRNMV